MSHDLIVPCLHMGHGRGDIIHPGKHPHRRIAYRFPEVYGVSGDADLRQCWDARVLGCDQVSEQP
jgi:hypothetical protein